MNRKLSEDSQRVENFLVSVKSLHQDLESEKKQFNNFRLYIKTQQNKFQEENNQQPMFIKLLNETQQHDQELEKLRLQKMNDDNVHRKQLMLLRVIGLQKIAGQYKYFRDVMNKNQLSKKNTQQINDNNSMQLYQ
ncbi:UNKNOWN [Stylonychia lemnae]|uniref:Uncharacterized protein n=1 Tax=Stylonychia lemnae TaxID=5949 RepID=A0A078AQ14_STYLE|nr:UNKNOWN [Stylonychia lemnae]|eukprot:CDW84450.1 UNKNOWN [Stylonychia lemnae]